jgi:DNA repair protein RadC
VSGESPRPDFPSVDGNLALALPEEEPRERLLRRGAHALSDAELLALLLGLGRFNPSALRLAREVLREQGGLAALVGVSPSALRHRGLDETEICALLANLELAGRLVRSEIPDREPISAAQQVAQYVWLRYSVRDQEVVGALWVDARRRLIGDREVYRGTFNRTTVEPREILKEALLRGAAGVIVFHTRPSGDPTPGAEDRAFMRRMAAAGEVVGVELIDHLIIGNAQRWVSLRKQRKYP